MERLQKRKDRKTSNLWDSEIVEVNKDKQLGRNLAVGKLTKLLTTELCGVSVSGLCAAT